MQTNIVAITVHKALLRIHQSVGGCMLSIPNSKVSDETGVNWPSGSTKLRQK